MNVTPTQDSGIINTLVMAFWALIGAVARSKPEFKDPETGRIDPVRVITILATAVFLGEIALAITMYFNINPILSFAIAGVLGNLGPSATVDMVMGFFRSKFGDTKNGDDHGTSHGK